MIVRPLPELGLYELVDDLHYPGGIVPKGFRWNGASFPRLTWTLLGYTPFHPLVMRGSGVHDYLYSVRTGMRRVADELFRATIIEDGIPEDVAAMMHAAVREYGMHIWMDDEDRDEMERRSYAEMRRIQEAP